MKPEITFSQWLKKYMLPDVNIHLRTVFEYTLFDGLDALFKQVFEELSDQSSMPIQYFPNKQNNLYIYDLSDDKECWKLMSNADLNKYITMIANEFHSQFSILNSIVAMTSSRDVPHSYHQMNSGLFGY